MGKYSEFEREGRDFYPTPMKAAIPVGPFLKDLRYIEPCAGDGRLIEHIRMIQPTASCIAAFDIEPQAEEAVGVRIIQRDIIKEGFKTKITEYADCFVTNPPWINNKDSGFQLNTIIESLSSLLPTWLLMNGSFVFNKKSAPYMRMCTDVVPIGRVRWIEGSAHSGKEDCAWYRFDNRDKETKLTYIHPRKD